MSGLKDSPEQRQSEAEYWRKQKEIVEVIIQDLNRIKLTPFNFWKVYRIIKKLIAAIGVGTTTTLIQQADLWEAILMLNESNASLIRQIEILHQRLLKLEGRQ